jgi:ferric-dicitrate binding protein FerR (iron transport regulator)
MNQSEEHIAEHLLLHYLQGTADEKIIAVVEEWLNADSRNREHLNRLESLWLESGKIVPPPVAVDVDAAWNRMLGRMVTEKDQPRTIHKEPVIAKWRAGYTWLAAASVLLLAGLFTLYSLLSGPATLRMVAENQVMKDTLPDGTVIALNTRSTLQYPATFDKKFRRVNLLGEALFSVEHKADQPFIIHAGDAEIRVLGTKFKVAAYPEKNMEVTVTEGTVQLYKADSLQRDTVSLILHAGESGKLLLSGQLVRTPSDSIPPDALFWANHTFTFRNTPLSQVCLLLEKYYHIAIIAENQAIMQCRLSATFDNEPADRIMTVIAESFGFTLKREEKRFILSGIGCDENGQ